MTVVAPALGAICIALLLPFLKRLIDHAAQVVRILYLTWNVPSAPCIPILGNVGLILYIWRDMHGSLLDILQRYGTLVRTRIFDRIVLVVMDPDDVQVVCTHPALASKPKLFSQLEHHIGKGLITINGPVHKRHRKAITPSLHIDILNDFLPIFAENATAVVRRFEEYADSGCTFDVAPEFGIMANMTIMETVLSSRTENDNYAANVEVLDSANHLAMWRAFRPWWENETLFKLSSNYKRYFDVAAAMDSFVMRILLNKSAEVAKGVPPPPRRRMAFLDHVLRSPEGAAMTQRELGEELKTFLFAGSTTSMDFMSFVALMFSMYPDVQSRVQQELDDVFGPPGTEGARRRVVPEDLAHLEYTECVLREVLRFVPPVPMYFRQASEDVRLPSGVLVPRGCLVCLVPAGTHRLARHFPDPLRFDPDRWLPGRDGEGRHPFCFIPFSAGSRNCLGQRYAYMFAKTAVATLLRAYSFLPAPGGPRELGHVPIVPGITISAKGGARLRVQRRLAPAPA